MRAFFTVIGAFAVASCNNVYGWSDYPNVDDGAVDAESAVDSETTVDAVDAVTCEAGQYVSGGTCHSCETGTLLLTPDATACCKQGFSAESTYALTTNAAPYQVATGDFNGDGHPDIVTANSGSNNVSVLLGNGDGTFVRQVTYGAGNGPNAVAVGDFDGDGHLDLVVANSGDNTVSVLLNDPANLGVFRAPVTYTVGNDPVALAVGEFTGDKHLDIVVVNNGDQTFSLLANDGSGAFSAKATFGTDLDPASIAAGDFDGDGYADVVVASLAGGPSGGGGVSVYLNDSNHPGQFLPNTDYDSTGAQWVAVGNLDSDSYLNLAVADHSLGQVGVLFNQGSGAPGIFGSLSDFGTGGGPVSVAVGDFNGDGMVDLATANSTSETVSILYNTGGRVFQSQPPVVIAVGNSPFSVAVEDFNGDGHPDIVVANFSDNTVGVALNGCAQ